ncbi:MAG: HAD family hydrolase, partial [Ruminococcus sp.]|uniref:HAD family hydrolase n=1 Tax=Ruminococcus sp. TaxID=41978 RepID=UPI0025F4FB5A
KWIFFDIGSTLVDESVAFRKRVEKTVANTNVSYDDFYNKMVEISKYNQNGYHKALEFYGLTMAPWNSDDEFVYPEAEECLRNLSKKYKIGIIANQVFGSEERLEKIGLLKYINLVVASAEEGVAKPDLRIFEIALSKADCKAVESVMVGDRLDNDIVPANKIGMKTVWIRQGFGGLAMPVSDDERADYTISNLRGLEDILGI